MDIDPDYITVEATVNPHTSVVVVMHCHKGDYIQTKVSQPMPHAAARALAHSWAEALRLEIR